MIFHYCYDHVSYILDIPVCERRILGFSNSTVFDDTIQMWSPSSQSRNWSFKNVVFCAKVDQLKIKNITFLITNSTKTIETLSFIVET